MLLLTLLESDLKTFKFTDHCYEMVWYLVNLHSLYLHLNVNRLINGIKGQVQGSSDYTEIILESKTQNRGIQYSVKASYILKLMFALI